MSPEIENVRQRMTLLELTDTLGTMSAERWQRNVARPEFDEYKQPFLTHGLEGLKDLPPIHHSHPLPKPPDVEARILAQNPVF
jgi:hypothetical protein